MPEFFVKMCTLDLGQTEEGLPLSDPDDDADAGGEADIHRRGNVLITLPSRAAPSTTRMMPAISVATCRPSTPYCAVMLARMTMKAPVGPAICTRLPPKIETARPAKIAV